MHQCVASGLSLSRPSGSTAASPRSQQERHCSGPPVNVSRMHGRLVSQFKIHFAKNNFLASLKNLIQVLLHTIGNSHWQIECGVSQAYLPRSP